MLFPLLIPIYFIRKAIFREREKSTEGVLSLGEGFVAGILVYFIGALLYFAVQGIHMFNDEKFKADGEKNINGRWPEKNDAESISVY